MLARPPTALIESFVAGVLLLALSPLLGLLAIAVAIDSPGPMFTRRRITTERQTAVDLIVFRTTRARGDDRTTRVGGFLQWTCLDHLPALWNVLVGDIRLAQAARSCSPSRVRSG